MLITPNNSLSMEKNVSLYLEAFGFGKQLGSVPMKKLLCVLGRTIEGEDPLFCIKRGFSRPITRNKTGVIETFERY